MNRPPYHLLLVVMTTHAAFHPVRFIGVASLIIAAIVGACGQYDFAALFARSGVYLLAGALVLIGINTLAFRAVKARL